MPVDNDTWELLHRMIAVLNIPSVPTRWRNKARRPALCTDSGGVFVMKSRQTLDADAVSA